MASDKQLLIDSPKTPSSNAATLESHHRHASSPSPVENAKRSEHVRSQLARQLPVNDEQDELGALHQFLDLW